MIPIRDTAPCLHKPYVTWGIIAICTSIFMAMKLMPDQAAISLLNHYGMVPIRYSAVNAGLPFDGYLRNNRFFLNIPLDHEVFY